MKKAEQFLKEKNIWVGTYVFDQCVPEKDFKLTELLDEYFAFKIQNKEKVKIEAEKHANKFMDGKDHYYGFMAAFDYFNSKPETDGK